jgi:peptidoglycan/xylan/chitin deacetylase (PgdA/CDA1 family)
MSFTLSAAENVVVPGQNILMKQNYKYLFSLLIHKMILCLHDITENPKNPWQMTPQELRDLLTNNKEITDIHFDDGRAGVIKYAPGILKPYMERIIVTIFIVPNWIILGAPEKEKYSEFLTWAQLKSMHEWGFEIGSHSLNHPDLTKCTDDQLYLEMKMSKDLIKQFLGITTTKFAYPYGLYDERVMHAAAQHYSTAFALNSKLLSNYEVPRKIVLHG